jgi:SET domain-containing protein
MSRRFITRTSSIHGKGVFAAAAIPAEEILIEYSGKRITSQQAERLHGNNSETGHTFLFSVNDKFLIDGNTGGNSSRWFNHSCAPNCQAQVHVNIDGDERRDKVLIESLRPIRAGEELTYDYGLDLPPPHSKRLKKIWECRCGAKNCTGTLLKPRKPAAKKKAAKTSARKTKA